MRHRLHILMLAVTVVLGALAPTAAGGEAVDNGRVAVSPTRDLAFPAAWAGEWRITTTYRRGDTHEVIAVDDVTDVIRAREPVGLSALTRGGLLHCSGFVTDGRLDVSCSRIIADGPCQFGGTFGMVADRTGETLVGSGELIAGATAGCSALPARRMRTTVELLGFRLGHDPGDPAAVLPPLLTRFVASAPLLLLAATSRQLRPVIKEDCKDDGWMSFTNLSFKNQGQCIKFVDEQDKAERDRHASHAEEGER